MGAKEKTPLSPEKKKEYLSKIFKIIRLQSNMSINDKKARFNSTELRMLGEILVAKEEGRRLISTRLADLLGITRSAVSQIVNRLESQGVVRRVAAENDKKIAYVEISDDVLEVYGEDLNNCLNFVGGLVREFGEKNFEQMCALNEKFVTLAQSKTKAAKCKK